MSNSMFETTSHFGRFIGPKRSNLILWSTAIKIVELNCFKRLTYVHNSKYYIRHMINSTFEMGLRPVSYVVFNSDEYKS